MTNPGRAGGFRSSRAVPAVEYLQSQRARSMMMMKLAEATARRGCLPGARESAAEAAARVAVAALLRPAPQRTAAAAGRGAAADGGASAAR